MKKSVFEQFCNGSSSTLDYSNGTPLDLGNEPPVAAIPSQCCAFLKLQKIVGASSDRTSRWNVSCHQFVLWVLIFRNQDPQIEEGVKRSCPLARCRYTGDPDDVKFIRHIVMCQFLKFGEYKCPYNKHETERFMVSQKKKRWHRGQELREAVLTCTRRLCKAFSHPITSTNSTQLDNTNEAHTSNNNCHPSWADYARFKCPMNSSANANYENPNADECGFPASREPNLKKRKPDDDTRRSTESHPYSPISSREAGCNDGGSYAAELDTEVIYELGSIPKPGPILGLSEMSNGDEHLRMDKDWLLNSSDYISMKDFNTPITRQAIRELGRSLQSCAASRIYLDVDFDESTSHKQRLQPSTSDLTTQVYKKRRRSKSPMLLSIDTGDHGSNLTPASSSIVATHYISSTPDSPGVPELEPGEFIKDLQSILFRVNCKAVAFLSISPRSAISSQISLEPLSAAHVYELGWMAVKTILGGGFPADIKILFCLAQLAVSCAQTVWGNSIIFQLDEFHCELENWAAVLPTEDQEAFIELISSILGPEMPVIQRGQLPRNTSNPHLSMSNSKSNRWNYLSSLSQQGRQKALKDGIAIRSCFQYLSTFEFLYYRARDPHQISYKGPAEDFQTLRLLSRRATTLINHVIKPLMAMDSFNPLRPALNRVRAQVHASPDTSVRDFELSLIIRARSHSDDYILLLQFEQKIKELISLDTFNQLGMDSKRSDIYLSYDIEMVCPSLNNTRALDVVSQNPSSSIQELPGVIPRRINTNVRGFRNRVSVVMDLGSHQPTASHNNFVRQDIVPEGITASPAIMSNTAQSLWPATPTSGPIHSETTISSRRSTWKTDSTTELTPSSSYSFYNPAQDTSFGQAPSAPVFYDPSSNCFSNPWPPLFDSHSSNQTVQDNDFKRMSGVGTQPSSDSSFNAPPNLSRFTEDSSFDFDGNPSIATDPPFAGVMEPNIRGPVKAENEIQSAIPNGQLQVESLICPYPDCGTRFTGEMKNQISNMLRHVRREVHSENRVSYACDECPKAYGRSSNLKQHRKSVHEIGT